MILSSAKSETRHVRETFYRFGEGEDTYLLAAEWNPWHVNLYWASCPIQNGRKQMARCHFYLPDDVAAMAKSRAKAVGKSLSAYLADLVVRDADRDWPEGFFEEVVGGWKGEPLRRPRQGRAERREHL
jgi:hypothetical protein